MNGPERRKTKHQRVFDHLSRDIVAGRYQAGQKLPSESALVRRFGVSRITIGHALRELQQRGLIDRVAGSGTYVRDVSVHARKGLLFGLIIPNLGETEIFEPICQGIVASHEAKGHALLWAHADAGSRDKEQQALQLCRQSIERGVNGVFFAPLEMTERSGDINRRVMRMLRQAGIAVVLLDCRPKDAGPRAHVDMVGIDNHRAGYLAAEHLLRMEARRVGFVAYRNQASTVRLRIAGYRDALAAHGRETGSRVFHISAHSHLPPHLSLLECDGFVCANDRVAGHLMQTLIARGIRIPADARIVGIDDVNYASLLPVPLTTIHQPCREIGEMALRTMLERLDRPALPGRDILLDCSLVVRRSCGS